MSMRIAVIGAGTMGAGIAQVAALSGLETSLCDLNSELLENARRVISASVAKGIEKGKNPPEASELLAKKVRYTTQLPEAVTGASWVVEAVPEDLELKVKVLSQVEAEVGDACILASNTSSLPITGLAARLSTPERCIGMHFFNPVPIMGLVEVVYGLQTSQSSIDCTVKLARRLGKEPIIVRDSPGFATSRLGVALGLEAIRMVESGVAGPAEIDRALELGYRHPMGPLRLTDLVGLDVRLAIAEHLYHELGERFRPPALLRSMVRAGRLGKKSGRGFYEW